VIGTRSEEREKSREDVQEFLHALITLPTVLFTVPLGFALLYWVFVIVGAADVDALGGAEGADGLLDGAADGALDGAMDGALDGAADGALDGAADGLHGVADGAAEGAAEGAVHGAHDAVGETGLAWVLSLLKLRSAPVTVTASLFFFFGWVISYLGNAWLWALLGEAIPGWAIGSIVFLIAFMGSLFSTSLVIRPIAPLFEHVTTRGGNHLVGKTANVRTSRVTATFGQAEIAGGAGILLHVRCTDENNGLVKNNKVLIIDYDKERDVYIVEPLQRLLSGTGGAEKVPAASNAKSAAPVKAGATRES
jgi:hypothetical protein